MIHLTIAKLYFPARVSESLTIGGRVPAPVSNEGPFFGGSSAPERRLLEVKFHLASPEPSATGLPGLSSANALGASH